MPGHRDLTQGLGTGKALPAHVTALPQLRCARPGKKGSSSAFVPPTTLSAAGQCMSWKAPDNDELQVGPLSTFPLPYHVEQSFVILL